MVFLILSILTTSLLFVHFKLFAKWHVDTFQAIVVNYGVGVVVGSLVYGNLDWATNVFTFEPWVLSAFLIGSCFVMVFLLTGISTQKLGMQVTTLAGKMALVIPALATYWLLGQKGVPGILQISGVALALAAVWLSSWKPASSKVGGFVGFAFPLLVFAGMGFTDTIVNYTQAVWVPVGKESAFTLIVFLAAFLLGLLISAIRYLGNRKKITLKSFVGGVSLGIPNYFSLYFLILALIAYDSNGGFVFPVANLGVILTTTLFAALVFKEKIFAVNYLGLALAIGALWMLAGQ